MFYKQKRRIQENGKNNSGILCIVKQKFVFLFMCQELLVHKNFLEANLQSGRGFPNHNIAKKAVCVAGSITHTLQFSIEYSLSHCFIKFHVQ